MYLLHRHVYFLFIPLHLPEGFEIASGQILADRTIWTQHFNARRTPCLHRPIAPHRFQNQREFKVFASRASGRNNALSPWSLQLRQGGTSNQALNLCLVINSSPQPYPSFVFGRQHCLPRLSLSSRNCVILLILQAQETSILFLELLVVEAPLELQFLLLR